MRRLLLVLLFLSLCGPAGVQAATPSASLTLTYVAGVGDPPTQIVVFKKLQGGTYAPLTQVPFGATMVYKDTEVAVGQVVCYQAKPNNLQGDGQAGPETCIPIVSQMTTPNGIATIQVTITFQ